MQEASKPSKPSKHVSDLLGFNGVSEAGALKTLFLSFCKGYTSTLRTRKAVRPIIRVGQHILEVPAWTITGMPELAYS